MHFSDVAFDQTCGESSVIKPWALIKLSHFILSCISISIVIFLHLFFSVCVFDFDRFETKMFLHMWIVWLEGTNSPRTTQIFALFHEQPASTTGDLVPLCSNMKMPLSVDIVNIKSYFSLHFLLHEADCKEEIQVKQPVRKWISW